MKYLSECITTWLIRHGTILQEDRELYEYATYSFILSISPVIMIMIIGGVMGKAVEGILIITPFMFMRKFSGGFHAKHAWVCMIFSCSILFSCLHMAAHINYSSLIDVIMICATICLIMFSPIDSENRRLDLSEKKKYKITVAVMIIVFVIIYCLLLIADYKAYAICIAEGIVLTACLQVPSMLGRIKLANKRENNATRKK